MFFLILFKNNQPPSIILSTKYFTYCNADCDCSPSQALCFMCRLLRAQPRDALFVLYRLFDVFYGESFKSHPLSHSGRPFSSHSVWDETRAPQIVNYYTTLRTMC